jgi:hypothetical protein
MAEKDVLYHELIEALDAEGCAVCRLARGASHSYIRALIYEGVTDVKLREVLRDARGLCYRHGWRLARQRGAVLGTAIIYQDVVNTLVRALEANTAAPNRLFSRGQQDLTRSLSSSAECPACVLERDAEMRTVKVLLSHMDDAELAEVYKRAGGICLPHFQLALSQAGAAAVKLLAAWQAEAWTQLRSELEELIRKHDYRFRSETITEAEADAWERAVAAIVGEGEPGEDTKAL